MSCSRPTRRFSHRVFRVFALSLLLVSTVFTTYFLFVQKRRMEAELLERGVTLASLLAGGSRTAVYSENAALVQDTLHGVLERGEVLAAAVFTKDRTLLAHAAKTPALKRASGALPAPASALIEDGRLHTGCLSLVENGGAEIFCPVLIRSNAPTGQALYFETEPEGGQKELIGFVRVTLDRVQLRRELVRLLLRSLLLVAVLLAAGTAAVFFLSRRVTEPLAQLTEAVRAYGAGYLVGRIPRSDDEIGRLGEAFTGMIRDLAERERERERLAERLRHAQKMEAVGLLSQGVSHDFKNILSTLKTAVHILQKGSADNTFVLKYTARIETTLDRARDLVERLISFSRTRELSLRSVDLAALLERLAPAFRDVLGEHVRLQLDLAGGPVFVLGDQAGLEQLLANLVYNARDAMPAGGLLCVRLEPLARGEGTPDMARLVVRDTGVGMEPNVRSRLFEPFFTTKDAGSGMGLGLSIVHGIVEMHRGRIQVESAPGEGTTFIVDLPLARAPEAPGPAVAAGAP
ncbi:MAG TPA: HAMP domain-containing sensor histidine kinase [Candidatus Methanoperedens sp.]|nr:HAMP domain-containing sensor histidine kinase [Candidatus Methanoperedens sp.]